MLRKIILIPALLISAAATASNEWQNDIYADKSAYSYSSSVLADNANRFEYKCSVLKFDDNKFGRIEYLNIDLDLELEEEKLQFQEKYQVNLIFSNGKEHRNNLPLKSGFNAKDRFTFYLNANDDNGEPIVNNLLFGNYVNVEVLDVNKKRMIYRFYLNGSKKSIIKTQKDCDLLYKTFK